MNTINIGGQARPFHVGTNQGDIFCRLQGLTLAQYGATFSDSSSMGFGVQRDFLFSALKAGYDRAGLPVDFTNLTVGDWTDAPDYNTAATLGVVLAALAQQFEARAVYQAERDAKNVPAPSSGPTSDATGMAVAV